MSLPKIPSPQIEGAQLRISKLYSDSRHKKRWVLKLETTYPEMGIWDKREGGDSSTRRKRSESETRRTLKKGFTEKTNI